MLRQLYIRNFTLIDELDITFKPGFSVITGETGAGKSIILGAIGQILGNRADARMVKAGCDKCVIEAHFDLSNYDMESFFDDNDIDYEPEDCIIRRELKANGKSRAFINDTPVALTTARELGQQLVDIHSQHQNLLLQKEDFQLNVVDIIAHNSQLLNDYRTLFDGYAKAKAALREKEEECEKDRANEDFLRFQADELVTAQLVDGEQEELEQELETLSHAEDIKGALFDADNLLSGDDRCITQSCKTMLSRLSDIGDVYPAIRQVTERIDSAYIELKDIARDISNLAESIDFDPARLTMANERLDTIYTLQKKHHVESVAELIAIRDNLTARLNDITNSEDMLEDMRRQVEDMYRKATEAAARLTESRQEAARHVTEQLLAQMTALGMPNARFEIKFETKELAVDGADRISYMFSANKNVPLEPIAQVASGGEVARVMLSLKAMISGAVKLPTIIFDEIDTGVSGRVAEMMAQIMRQMGQADRQVISITHLPQIAALGTTHYKVEKTDTDDTTISRMRMLGHDERITEIAQMLSGSNISDAAIENAKSLLEK
ncbi:DNA repair protein RecN [Prevotella sp. P3-122]|uniref:DNA repair protein RecN n=1 Tax=Prevotella sp. P3-122 TaxID=2024223 RepID=UPI000B96C2C1|nr:DNA repair protein RecN [Prevotella sp. P3-122]OYP60357.1 DNA repair protein RecN [Prevotella sp. P3-122]